MISNAITIFRTLLIAPLFALLAFGDGGWATLAVFLGAGLLDMVDGRVARALKETSALGAMLDLIGDRLLTLGVVLGLIVGGGLGGVHVIAGFVLIGRDVVVASLNEALPGKLEIKVSAFEKVKIVAAFSALTLLIAPAPFERQHDLGLGALWLAAGLTLITLIEYWRRALRAFRA